MLKAFLASWGGAYRDGARLFGALPWLAALMIAVELAQHVVEWRLGMFGPPASRAAAAEHPIRLLFGWAKMATFFVVSFHALRYYALADARAALRPTRLAVRRFAGVVAFQAVITAGVLHAGALLTLLGLPAGKEAVTGVRVVLSLLQQLLEPALFLWYVNAAVGTGAFGPVDSTRTTGLLWFWGLPLIFLTRLPLSLVHQLLNRWPAGQGAWVQVPALALDAVVVVMIAGSIAAVQVRGATVIAQRRRVPLLGGEQGAG